ncbi:TPA: glucosyltransferase domain-containing protein [Serratia fonticola]
MFCKDDKKTLFLYSGLALLFIYPLILAGVFYRDDLDRAITGQYGWRGLGRPIADILMKILSASGQHNLDLFPYTMIVSCLFIGGASLLLCKHLIQQGVPHAKFIAALLIFNPYLLQNIAYRYDSLGMAIAFFLAVLSYAYRNSSRTREISTRLISGVLALTLYQPCTNIFIGLLAIDIMVLAVKNGSTVAQVIKLILKKAMMLIGFYIIYMLFFAVKSNSRANIISPTAEGFEQLLNTMKGLKELVFSYFYGPVYIYFLIPAVTAFIFMIINNYPHKNKIAYFIICTILSCFIFLVSLMGPTIFLQDAPVFPRTLVSFSVLMVIIAIPIMCYLPRLKYLTLIPAITAFAFSAQLSSAMKSQREYENFVFNMIARDIVNHPKIELIGTIGQVNIDERVKLIMSSKPLVGYFLSPASEFLASFQLINKGLTQTLHGYVDEQANMNRLAKMIDKGIKPISSNKDYSLYIFENEAIVTLGVTNE